MISAHCNVGRLVEIRMHGLITEAELNASVPEFQTACARAGSRLVLCCDQRGMSVLPKETAEALLRIMRNDNAIVERNGVVVSGDAIQDMQARRLARSSSREPIRRIFADPTAAEIWLSEVLNDHERRRLNQFLFTRETPDLSSARDSRLRGS